MYQRSTKENLERFHLKLLIISGGRLGSLLHKLVLKLVELSRFQGGRFLLSASAAVGLTAENVEAVSRNFSVFNLFNFYLVGGTILVKLRSLKSYKSYKRSS
jgi:lipoprotein signal peptidase